MPHPERAVVAVLIAFAVGACTTTSTPRESDTAAVRQAIDSSNARFAEHFKAGQMEQVASHYTENAVAMPPNMPAASGRAAIQELFSGMVQGTTVTDFRLTTTDLRVSGDMARERGRYTMTMDVPGQGTIADSGKFVVVWQRQADGSWLMDSDVWNSDVPMPAPAAPDTSAARRSS